MRLCKKCKEFKPTSSFSRDNNLKDGVKYHCKECVNLANDQRSQKRSLETAAFNERNPDYYKVRSLRKNYNLTLEELEALEVSQSYCCSICRKKKKLHVDHDHDTGTVRGLLCFNCNTALGKFEDSTEILEAALKYIKANRLQ